MAELMKKQPLVSCIVIFFNAGEKFFIEAIESIFAQTYENWELLLANDGSTDESTAIALKYAQEYPHKVRYLEHEGHQNRGMSATRNLGIRHAKGEYIAFLDADDVWLPQKLEQQVPLLESYPEAAMLYSRTQYWFSWMKDNPATSTLKSDAIRGDYMTITSIKFDQLIEPPTQLLVLLKTPNIHPCTCSILIRRQVFDTLGFFEEAFRGANEDMVFHSKIFLKFPVYVSSGCWDRYRKHEDSYWGNLSRQGTLSEMVQAGRLKYLNWLEQYLQEQNIQDREIWQELQKALWPHRHLVLFRLLQLPQNFIKQTKHFSKHLANRLLPAHTRQSIEEYVRLILFQGGVKLISSSPEIHHYPNDWIVLCVVSNGEFYIETFINHYFSIGAKHIIFLDNGSTDRTINLASKHGNVTILQTTFKHPVYNRAMKKYLINRFAKNRLFIFAEVDELFTSPLKEKEEHSLSQASPI
ncbi:glycosyl transferase family 2 [Crinalium epipsammum PCC 9333]|uniref:Glycosyl transferase family 2 n=2 Tax=Crinalium TaxID=241421 RepID=K9W1L1_9CYAN|nr:glycosyl transferase family 2 [Crinalium epipsammum PCC 9333]